MARRRRAPMRALRTTTLVSTSVGLGCVAHTHAGGPTLHPAALLVVALLLAIPVARLARGPVRAPVALSVLGAGQLLVHLCARTALPPPTVHLSGGHAGHLSSGAIDSATTQAHQGVDVRMLLAHLLVSVVLAVLWAHGERILCAAADRLHLPEIPRWTALPVLSGALGQLGAAVPSLAPATTRVRGPPTA